MVIAPPSRVCCGLNEKARTFLALCLEDSRQTRMLWQLSLYINVRKPYLSDYKTRFTVAMLSSHNHSHSCLLSPRWPSPVLPPLSRAAEWSKNLGQYLAAWAWPLSWQLWEEKQKGQASSRVLVGVLGLWGGSGFVVWWGQDKEQGWAEYERFF